MIRPTSHSYESTTFIMHKLQLKILACYKIGCVTYCIEIKINKILNMKKYKSLEWTEKVEILEVIYKAKPD